ASAFVNRRPELRTRYSRRYNYQRAKNEDPKALREWFNTVQRVINENRILPEDIYNFDETGFAMGLISTAKVTVIESICADGYILPPCVIFKGKNYCKSWFNNLPSNWRFEVSDNGWTTDKIGLRWLQKLFVPGTTTRTKGKYRLLILDGHGSHLTPQFDQICSENAIIPLRMPAHSSHLLQPLDIGCFATLKRSYGRVIESQARTGYNYIDKLDFLAAYLEARVEAYKSETIRNSFASAGLVPLNAERVLFKAEYIASYAYTPQ
ncbi:Pogo transposable element, partial [Aspergillus sclerotialis]